MALQDFIKVGYYSQIGTFTLDMTLKEIRFDLRTLDQKNGTDVISPISFRINRAEEIEKEYNLAVLAFPSSPDYPQLCVDREAMVPMWTEESTQKEIDAYNVAKDGWESDMAIHKENINALETTAKEQAIVDSDFENYFSTSLMFETSNPIKCAYNFIKSQNSFSEVKSDE